MNARELMLRDPATAALVGAFAGADFGAEFGDDFGDEIGFGDDFGDDSSIGDEFGAAPAPSITPEKALQLWRNQQAMRRNTSKRTASLDPNRGSTVKIERYIFSLLNQGSLLLFGATNAIDFSDQPDVTVRPRRVLTNVPICGLAMINDVKVANVSVSVGHGQTDGFFWNANGVGIALDVPTVTPSMRATVLGDWTGVTPLPWNSGDTFPLSIAFIGPAKMAG